MKIPPRSRRWSLNGSMYNPLNKRFVYELKKDWIKYLILFIFLVVTIGYISGFLVADYSIVKSYDESFEKYNVEDGHFTLIDQIKTETIEHLAKDIHIYELFYKEYDINGKTHRLYPNREIVNKVAIHSGANVINDDEISIDRLYAENNNLNIGDYLKINNHRLKIVGYLSLPDYSALFKNNNDTMFDANNFNVAIVNQKTFDSFNDIKLFYNYAYKNNHLITTTKSKEHHDNIKETIFKDGNIIIDYVDRNDNQAIVFAGRDLGEDAAMMKVLLYIIIAIIVFIFGISIKSKIERDSRIIGTLRASGFSKRSILIHYLTLPFLIVFSASIIGNVLGYTYFKETMGKLYYHSYSLVPYTTYFDFRALVETTIIPGVLVIVINYFIIKNGINNTIINLLNNKIKYSDKHKIRLPFKSFTTRFRIRIILQNINTYIVLFIGIYLATILLMMGIAIKPMLADFKKQVIDNTFANYQYTLKTKFIVNDSDASEYDLTKLNINHKTKITIYGLEKDNPYLKDVVPDKIYISKSIAEKYHYHNGDTLKLYNEYNNKQYEFKIAGIKDYIAQYAVFIEKDYFENIFNGENEYLTGYLSNKQLDINDQLILSTLTKKDLTAITDQMVDSMGSVLITMNIFTVMMYLMLMFLLTKIVIEKNTNSISIIKILGYSKLEISKLYNRATFIVVIISSIVALPLAYFSLKAFFEYLVFEKMNGWFPFMVEPKIMFLIFIVSILCYLLVSIITFKKIGHIPMQEALKYNE